MRVEHEFLNPYSVLVTPKGYSIQKKREDGSYQPVENVKNLGDLVGLLHNLIVSETKETMTPMDFHALNERVHTRLVGMFGKGVDNQGIKEEEKPRLGNVDLPQPRMEKV